VSEVKENKKHSEGSVENIAKPKKSEAQVKSKSKSKDKDIVKDEGDVKKEKPKKELKPKIPSEMEKKYFSECVPALKTKFNYKNIMQVPRLQKIIVNTSIKEALQDVKILQAAAEEIAAITGLRPVITKAKKSIANFKLREGQSIGARVTLRGKYMYEFVNRLFNVAMPRVRDFKGVSPKSFDGRGNYTLGITEQTIFPEINFDKVSRTNGMNITFVTSAKTDDESRELLALMGMPFRR
jgi:large subunit ribosomal protein L5